MKIRWIRVDRRLGQIAIIAILLTLPGPFLRLVVAQATDPDFRVAIARTHQSVSLSWFGSNGVPYQVESSSDFGAWTNSSDVITGRGAILSLTSSTESNALQFFRVKQLPPPEIITASFDPMSGILTIVGDELNNTIIVSRDATGALLVNQGMVTIAGGIPTVANTVLIQIFGRAGHDTLSLDESNGALPPAQLFGEAGDDALTGGSGADILNGASGADTLLGRGGMDNLFGGDDDDVIIGGDGNDNAQLGNGNDRFVWNPGDDTDVIEGGDGLDTVEVNGGNGDESFTVTANGTRVRFDRINPAPFFLDLGTCETLRLNANGGNDTFSATGNLAALIQITVDGGPGDDSLLGSNGSDILSGGDGKDFVDGNQGNDIVFLGADDDIFQWDPGDGNDVVEGQDGNDTLNFNGSNTSENFNLSANGNRLRLTRDVGNIVMDVNGIEALQCTVLGGADTITVGDLTLTDITGLTLRLASVLGGNTGDAQVDSVIVNGTAGDESILVTQVGGDVTVAGLKPMITILTPEATDTLILQAQGGDDTINAAALTSVFTLTMDGGPGDDTLIGSSQADVLIGGTERDTFTGGRGNDVILGGDGNDLFIWNPGDGSDIIEGQAGTDQLLFNASNANENLDLSANGARLLLFRDVGNFLLDANDVENVEIKLLGGVDTVAVNDLTTTDVMDVIVDLSAAAGGGDTQLDSVIVSGTSTNDLIMIAGSPEKVAVTGLSASLTIVGSEANNDSLTINALGGLDQVDASDLEAGAIQLRLNGGLGEDVLIGSQGDDLIIGGDGNDLVFGGAGNDTFVWNPGDDNDVFEGQADQDTLQFNGSNVGEIIDLSANGNRLRFTRNVANVVMDCNDVEIVRFEALGGADVVVVNDLSGTDVTTVNINLASTLGGSMGDAQADSILVNGTSADDSIIVAGASGSATVAGLAATVNLSGAEPANDRLTINTLAGDDSVSASGLASDAIALILDGGDDADVLIGGAGADVLLGGLGDDVLIGGPGLDVLDGGPGNNVLIQD